MSIFRRFFNRENPVIEDVVDNVEVLKLIYDEMELSYHEGEFVPKTWRRPQGLTGKDENARIITDFAGLSISYDETTKEYALSIPVKFSTNFVEACSSIIRKKYVHVTVNSAGYTKVIMFKSARDAGTDNKE